MNFIKQNLSKHILMVGPQYKDHRGGIGAIIATYSTIFENFKFFSSYQPSKGVIGQSLFFIKQLFVLRKTLSTDKEIEIIHIHGSHRGSFFRKFIIFYIAKKMYHKKVIYHLNSSSYDIFYNNSNPLVKRLIKYFIENVDLMICVSPWWKEFYSSNFKCKAIIIINNAVNDAEKQSVQTADTEIVKFLFLGRVGDRKGIFDLLDVLSKDLALFNGRMKLYIGGDGDIEKLTAVIKENSLDNIVEYIGWVSAEKKAAYLQTSNVYILPSYNEGLPVSILEAMSYGLPIVSTNIGGTPEVLEDGVNGYMFTPGDKAAIKNSIIELLEHKEKLKEFGDASLLKVTPYLPPAVAEQLTACYNNLLKNS